ncbi:RNA polymerase sigma factor [Parasediminibacterium sp. JCM 36343]|uniref:RNA polymerase sigma factor n=1 Tax=Parasediminibacterium sp. JCM 36343 TaxID=3374279 RepID=UPI00397B283C
MQTISDKVLLDNLKNESNASFEVLYQFYFPSVATYISQNFGNNEDAEDVFQEAIIVLLHKVRERDFVLTSSLKTYLFAIARNLWLKKLRDNKLGSIHSLTEVQEIVEPFTFELQNEPTKEEKVSSWMKNITENCQRILKAIFFYNESMGSLMQKMGWKNKHTAANQQYKCIQQVKKQKSIK